MQEDDIDQINLLVDLTTNKINQQLRANDKLSEGIYRILVNLDQVKDAVKKGEGWFFQNLSTHIATIENECKELSELSEKYKNIQFKVDNFFDVHNISLKSVKDEFEFLNAFVDTLNENIKDINENIKKVDTILENLRSITETLKTIQELKNKVDETSKNLTNFETSIKQSIDTLNINMSKSMLIIEEFHKDKINFQTWKSKVVFFIIALGPTMSFFLLLHTLGAIDLSKLIPK